MFKSNVQYTYLPILSFYILTVKQSLIYHLNNVFFFVILGMFEDCFYLPKMPSDIQFNLIIQNLNNSNVKFNDNYQIS